MINFNEFLKKHGIKIIDDQKRAYRFNKINTKYFQSSIDYNEIIRQSNFDTEPLYTIEIAESELEKIARFEMEVMNHLQDRGHYNLFEEIMEQKQKERYLKDQYPAVKKAYEQYSLMLKLAESGKL